MITRSLHVLLIFIVATAAAQPTTRNTDGLRAACDLLLSSSVVVGQNRAWSSGGDPVDKRGGKRFDFSPDVTPARGLILIRAAKVLSDPKYLAAADGVARALAAAQLASGYVPAAVTMLPAGPRSELHRTPILPASSTAAAVAFWLAYVDAGATPPDRWRSCARNGVNWLAQQQLGAGGFLTPTTTPAIGAHPTRRIDLTNTYYRNIVFTLLLNSRLEASRPAATAAEKAVNRLLLLRLMNQSGAPATAPAADDDPSNRNRKAALRLWAGVYEADGTPADDETRMHILASSQAIQMLQAEALLSDKAHWRDELRDSVDALKTLESDGRWPWQSAALPTTQPTTDAALPAFGTIAAATQPSAFDLPAVLTLDAATQSSTIEAVTAQLERKESLNERLAAVVCGLKGSLDGPADSSTGNLWNDLNR